MSASRPVSDFITKDNIESVAFLAIDPQKDFCENKDDSQMGKKGSLCVTDSDSIIPTINGLQQYFNHKYATQDFHRPGHVSFASTHKDKVPLNTKKLSKYVMKKNSGTLMTQEVEQTLWPDHCVQGTEGAKFHKDYNAAGVKIFKKGQKLDSDSYGAFEDNYGEKDTELAKDLKENNITTLVVSGLALDFCVRASIEQALRKGFRVVLVRDATKPVIPANEQATLTHLEALGVCITTAAAITQLKLAKVKVATQEKKSLQDEKRVTPDDFDATLKTSFASTLSRLVESKAQVSKSSTQINSLSSPTDGSSSSADGKDMSAENKTAQALFDYVTDQLIAMRKKYSSSGFDSDKYNKLRAIQTGLLKTVGIKDNSNDEDEKDSLDSSRGKPKEESKDAKSQPFNLAKINAIAQEVKGIVRVHQDTGIKGFFKATGLRNTSSLNKFNEVFEEKAGVVQTKQKGRR